MFQIASAAGQTLQVSASSKRHVATKSDKGLRELDSQKLLDLAKQLHKHLERTSWASSKAWQPFMSDVCSLAKALEKLGQQGAAYPHSTLLAYAAVPN